MRPQWIVICILFFAFAAFAQDDSGSITGVVTDQDGAVVSGAPIQAKNLKTGMLYKTVSSATGSYTLDRKSTRLNSSHLVISYAVFCLKKKTIRTMRF